jgi:hypothetical protein
MGQSRRLLALRCALGHRSVPHVKAPAKGTTTNPLDGGALTLGRTRVPVKAQVWFW